MTTAVFLHGLDSSGRGTKGSFLTERFPGILCPDFSGSLADRLDQFMQLCKGTRDLVLVGSSFGGLMATCHTIRFPETVHRLVLLAPALNFEGYTPPDIMIETPTVLVIGRNDTVTPAGVVLPMAEKTFAQLEIQLVEDDHMLHNTFRKLDWQNLLH